MTMHFGFFLIREYQDYDKVGSMKKVVNLHGFCCWSSRYELHTIYFSSADYI